MSFLTARNGHTGAPTWLSRHSQIPVDVWRPLLPFDIRKSYVRLLVQHLGLGFRFAMFEATAFYTSISALSVTVSRDDYLETNSAWRGSVDTRLSQPRVPTRCQAVRTRLSDVRWSGRRGPITTAFSSHEMSIGCEMDVSDQALHFSFLRFPGVPEQTTSLLVEGWEALFHD